LKDAWRAIFDTIKVLLVFVVCTVLFYFGLKWLDENYEGYHQYDQPSDGAVKVFKTNNEQHVTPTAPVSTRFFQFLRDGE